MKNLIKLFLVSLIFCSCYDYQDYFEKRDPSLRNTVEFSTGALANGMDSVLIKVYFPPGPNPELVKVNFTTREGVFIENSKSEFSSSILRWDDSNMNPYISATIKSTTKKGSFPITIEVPDVFRTIRPVTFLTSYPNAIKTNKNKFAVSRSFKDEIQLIANLSALRGLPSEGTPVEFVVADSISSNNSSLFRSLTKTDRNGQASVYFSPGLFAGYSGPVTYRVIARNELDEIITTNGIFNIVEP